MEMGNENNLKQPHQEVMNDHQMYVWVSDRIDYFRKVLRENPELPIEQTTKIFNLLKAAGNIKDRLDKMELISKDNSPTIQ